METSISTLTERKKEMEAFTLLLSEAVREQMMRKSNSMSGTFLRKRQRRTVFLLRAEKKQAEPPFCGIVFSKEI